MSLDETAVPMALTRNASLPPYASDPRYCYAHVPATGDVTHFPAATLENNTLIPGGDVGIVAVVDRIIMSSQAFVNTQYQIGFARRSILIGLSVLATRIGVGNDDGQGNAVFPQAPRCQVFADAVTAPNGLALWAPSVNAAKQPYTLDFNGGVVLYANDIIQIAALPQGATTHDFHFYWREYNLRAS